MAIDLHGRTALVTGASSGIGEAFARRLAGAGADLVLVARRKERLDGLAQELSAKHEGKASVLALDLSLPESRAELFARTEGAGTAVDVLVNNAGFGVHAAFLDVPWERTEEQIRLNVAAVVELTWRFGRAMRERGRGHILNVASLGAFSPTPAYATYCASKAYVRDFTEAVGYELRGAGVHLTALCPGFVPTEFQAVAGHELSATAKWTAMSAEAVVEQALRALFAGRPVVVPGLANRLSAFGGRLLPRRAMTALARRIVGTPTVTPTLPPKPSRD